MVKRTHMSTVVYEFICLIYFGSVEKTKLTAKTQNDLANTSFCSRDQSLSESFVEKYFNSEDNSFDEHDSYNDYSTMFIKFLLFLILHSLC